MKRLISFLPVIALLCSCSGRHPMLNRRLSLWRKDDIPYGTKIAFDALPHLFPDADVSVNKTSLLPIGSPDNRKAYIVICSRLMADEGDIIWMMNFVGGGNQIFISANRVSESLMHNLKLRTTQRGGFSSEPDSLSLGVYDPGDELYHSYFYPGDSYDNWVTGLDSQYTSILGRDARGHPDFVRISYKGGGAIYLHFAPLAFSNFFLLHKENMAYYEQVMSYIPSSIKEVVWDDYFRYEHGGSSGFFDSPVFKFIAANQALRWGFWLLLLLFLIIYLFDSKRRQRMVPFIGPPRNTSLDFVRTIGQLYYQRRDNHNLAMKMAVHFQDQIRTRYHPGRDVRKKRDSSTSWLTAPATRNRNSSGWWVMCGNCLHRDMSPMTSCWNFTVDWKHFINIHNMEENLFEQRTDLEALDQAVQQLKAEIGKVIVGQEAMIELLLAGILADGHILIEGVPGVAKTLTAKLLSKVISVGFSRIQFTPDLMPSDVIGTSVFNPRD